MIREFYTEKEKHKYFNGLSDAQKIHGTTLINFSWEVAFHITLKA